MKNNIFGNKLLLPIIIVLIATAGVGVYSYSTQVTAQMTSLGQVANSVQKLYPIGIPLAERADTIDGVNLTLLSYSDQSETIDRSTGSSKSKIDSGKARLELKYGVQGINDMIVGTITNTGKNTIYLKSFVIFGQTSEGMEPLNAYLVDASYSPESFGNIPKPTITSVIAITPDNSYSGYIVGKWNSAGMPIQSFSIGAVYQYDVNSQEYLPDNNWSIAVTETKTP